MKALPLAYNKDMESKVLLFEAMDELDLPAGAGPAPRRHHHRSHRAIEAATGDFANATELRTTCSLAGVPFRRPITRWDGSSPRRSAPLDARGSPARDDSTPCPLGLDRGARRPHHRRHHGVAATGGTSPDRSPVAWPGWAARPSLTIDPEAVEVRPATVEDFGGRPTRRLLGGGGREPPRTADEILHSIGSSPSPPTRAVVGCARSGCTP